MKWQVNSLLDVSSKRWMPTGIRNASCARCAIKNLPISVSLSFKTKRCVTIAMQRPKPLAWGSIYVTSASKFTLLLFLVCSSLRVEWGLKLFLFLSSSMIDDRPLRFRGEVYHPYHFNCSSCGVELNADAREVKSRPGFTANEMVPNQPSSHFPFIT